MIFAASSKNPAKMIPPWILHFGAAGVFGVALFDASPIPLPIPGSTDVLVLLLGASGNPWILAATAVAGTVLGGYLTWLTGKKGGEALFHRYMKKRHRWRDRITRWMKNHAFRTVFISGLLPPPFPLLPFMIAAGAFGVSRRDLFLGLTLSRTLRYGAEAALTILYGHLILHLWNNYLSDYAQPILYTFIAIVVASAIFGVWKFRRDMRHDRESGKEPSKASAA